MTPHTRLASVDDLPILVELVGAYHEFEGLALAPHARADAIRPLLEREELGRIWIISVAGEPAGYIALCFGYSIEFAGRDAFVDEFFISQRFRGHGVGRAVLESVAAQARQFDVNALHLEVAKTNERAQRLYAAVGFEARRRYQLMTMDLNSDERAGRI